MTKEEMECIEKECGSYYDKLYYYSLSRLDGDKDAAENCVQDTYLKLQEAINNDACIIQNYPGWMFRVLNNTILHYRREENRKRTYEFDLEFFCQDELTDPDANVTAVTELNEIKDLLKARTAQLDDMERKLLIDIYYRERKLSELAAETGNSINCMQKRKQRLLHKLKKIFHDIEGLY